MVPLRRFAPQGLQPAKFEAKIDLPSAGNPNR
jgi:hypothetical protein